MIRDFNPVYAYFFSDQVYQVIKISNELLKNTVFTSYLNLTLLTAIIRCYFGFSGVATVGLVSG